MASSFGKGQNLLITYIENFKYYDEDIGDWVSHPDPTFETEWSYCTGHTRLLKCNKGNYVFFQTTKKGYNERFITAYFVVEAIGKGKDIVPRYGLTGPASHSEKWEYHFALVGNKNSSRKLKDPGLKFDKNLAERLEFEPPKRIKFDPARSELQCISSATRNIRALTDNDVRTLLKEIDRLRL